MLFNPQAGGFVPGRMSNDASDPAKSSLVFAIITVVPAWVFIAAACYEKLELLTWLQRAIQRSTGALAIVFRPHGVREVNLSSERSAASSGSKSL